MWNQNNTVAVGVTGASGAIYALRLLEELIRAEQRVWLMLSDAAKIVLQTETGLELPESQTETAQFFAEKFNAKPGQFSLFGNNEWTAPVASGSGGANAMVVCPCSMGTLAAIAHGMSDSLLERAADVMIKESRKLILVPRETPFSAIHLENMLKLSKLGVTILPPNPGFYHQPQTTGNLVDFIVARILNQLGIEQNLLSRWGESEI